MQHSTTSALYRYWNEVRQGRVAPRRFDIEPTRIGAILPDTFILERVDPKTFSYRLAGTRACERFGEELRGRNFLDGWPQEERAELESHLSALADQGAALVLTVGVGSIRGGTGTLEIALLPLMHTHGTIDRVLGSISAIGEIDWLGYHRILSRRCLKCETVWPDGRPHALIGRGDRQSTLGPNMRNARIVRRDRMSLRVYDGGLEKTGLD